MLICLILSLDGNRIKDVLVGKIRCIYCGKYGKVLASQQKCLECEVEFKTIVEKITKRYDGALKKLAER